VGMVISGTSGTSASGEVIVAVTIRRYGSDVLVEGLPLRSLVGLQGVATFATQWESTEPGAYIAEVALRNAAGDVLDRQIVQFTVGIADGEITSFSVTPTVFDPGAPVALSLTFANTGTVPLTGMAMIQVQTDAGAVVHEYSHNFAGLDPDGSTSFVDVWDTTGVARGGYRIVAYVLYESTATEPRVVGVRTNRPVYLPLVVKSS
jgi:hypothetical protein